MPRITPSDLEVLCTRLASSAEPDVRRVYADEARWAFATFEWQIREGGNMKVGYGTMAELIPLVDSLEAQVARLTKERDDAKAEAECQAKRANDLEKERDEARKAAQDGPRRLSRAGIEAEIDRVRGRIGTRATPYDSGYLAALIWCISKPDTQEETDARQTEIQEE